MQTDDTTDLPDRKKRRTPLESPPVFCGVSGCKNEINLLMARSKTPEGKEIVSAFSLVGIIGRGGDPAMKHGFEFIIWIGRCWGCHDRETDYAKMDWREKAIRVEAKCLGLTKPVKGENLTQYMERHNIDKKKLSVLQPMPREAGPGEEQRKRQLATEILDRIPGCDDDLGD